MPQRPQDPQNQQDPQNPPNPFVVAAKYGLGAAFAALVCCVAPAVLVLAGLMGGVAALSFTGRFYEPDGSASPAGWALRGVAVLIGALAVLLYRRKQNQCSVDPARKRKNLALLVSALAVIGLAAYLGLDRASTAVFESVVAPRQQSELVAAEIGRAREAIERGDPREAERRLDEAEALVNRAAGFRTKRGTALFDPDALARLRAPIEAAREELTPWDRGNRFPKFPRLPS
jgi:hypothetical protein